MSELLELPRWAFEIAAVLFALSVSGVVILERRQPATTLAWILALFLLPVLGVLLYFAVGRRPYRRERRKARSKPRNLDDSRAQLSREYRLPTALSPAERGLVHLALTAAAAPLRRAERVEFRAGGDDAWQSIREAISQAQHRVHLQFYIWRDDRAGRRMIELLCERARAGVKVRILYDYIGSLGVPRSHFAPLIALGGEVETSGRIYSARLRSFRANYRNHRKLIVVDQRVGFLGGINVADEYLLDSPRERHWRDLVVRLEGTVVLSLEDIFQEDWLDTTGELPDLGHWTAKQITSDGAGGHAEPVSGPLVQIIPSGPDARLAFAISAQINAAIGSALERCWIATPYLIPDEALKLTITTAAMRGVDLRLLIPEKSDHRLVTYAARSYLDTLFDAGCEIYLYPEMLHAKYLVVDQGIAAIGSANMDIRSFHLNYEATAMFYSRPVNADLARIFEADQARARKLQFEDRQGLGFATRGAEAVARLLSPLL